jgi:hypothetical protein
VSEQFTRSPAPGQGAGPIVFCANRTTTRTAAEPSRAWGAVPHDLAADPRLSATAVRVAVALLHWARNKADCWPSDASIASRSACSVATVQRSLRGLEKAGWIVRQKTPANRTGRLIRLAWRGIDDRPGQSPTTDPLPPPLTDEEETGKRDASKQTDAALLDRLKTEGLPDDLARRFAQGERATAAARVLANVAVLRSQGRLTNPAGYIRAGIEQGYALLPAASKRIEAERRAEELAQRNARAALAHARARAERDAEERAEASRLATLEASRLAELVQRAVAELPAGLTRRNPTIQNAFVRARVLELERETRH